MRYLLIIFSIVFTGFSCVKKSPKDPIPVLTFKDFQYLGSAKSDSVLITLGYEDFDGDLFRNNNTDGPNLVLMPYVFNTDSNKFIKDSPIARTITQPAEGYYKGKSIQGDIILTETEFRSKANLIYKVVKFEVFMVDMKGNKSNVAASPQYTLQ